LNSRLEKLSLEPREADEIYLEVSEHYARLAELSINDRSAAGSALSKADDYLKRIEGPLQSSERTQHTQKMVRSFNEQTKQAEAREREQERRRRVLALVNSAKAALSKGIALEKAADFKNAVAQYQSTANMATQILQDDPNNADVEAMKRVAVDAAVRISLSGKLK
jgi:hypothetical protein